MNEVTRIQKIARSAHKYNSPATARRVINEHTAQRGKWSLILGDDGLVWMVTNREASILARAGYQYA